MKIAMSDVFNSEMTADDLNVYMGHKLIRQGDGEDKFDCADRYAAHAINCHDELVEALANIENDDGRIPSAIWDLRNKALAKARGGL